MVNKVHGKQLYTYMLSKSRYMVNSSTHICLSSETNITQFSEALVGPSQASKIIVKADLRSIPQGTS